MASDVIWKAAARIVAEAGDRDAIDLRLLANAAPAVMAGDVDALQHWRLVSDAIECILVVAGTC